MSIQWSSPIYARRISRLLYPSWKLQQIKSCWPDWTRHNLDIFSVINGTWWRHLVANLLPCLTWCEELFFVSSTAYPYLPFSSHPISSKSWCILTVPSVSASACSYYSMWLAFWCLMLNWFVSDIETVGIPWFIQETRAKLLILDDPS